MMRTKRRYIAVSVVNLPGEGFEQLEDGFYRALAEELGALEYHKANPKIIRFAKRSFILRVGLEKYRETIAALALIKRISDLDVAFYTTGSSGTIKALVSRLSGSASKSGVKP